MIGNQTRDSHDVSVSPTQATPNIKGHERVLRLHVSFPYKITKQDLEFYSVLQKGRSPVPQGLHADRDNF